MHVAHVARSHLTLLLALLLVVAGGACRAPSEAESAARAESSREQAQPDPSLVVAVARVEGTQRPNSLLLDGTLVADQDSNVASLLAGQVVRVFVERGSVVAQNDPLVELRDVDYRLQSQAARSQLEQARARLGMTGGQSSPPKPETMPAVRAAQADAELAANKAQRTEMLARSNSVSPQTLDEARSRAAAASERYQQELNNAQAAVAALESARVAVSQAKRSVADTVVRAPFAGEIAERLVSPGEYVSPQMPLVQLVRTNPLRIELQVPQRYLTAAKVGEHVQIHVDAIDDRSFDAEVRYVSAAVREETRSLTIEAVVPNDDGLLRPGLFVTATLNTGGTRQVTVVPASAVYTRAGVSRVFVVHELRVEERIVALGERDGTNLVITDGLRDGEQVAVEALDRLADGMTITTREPKA